MRAIGAAGLGLGLAAALALAACNNGSSGGALGHRDGDDDELIAAVLFFFPIPPEIVADIAAGCARGPLPFLFAPKTIDPTLPGLWCSPPPWSACGACAASATTTGRRQKKPGPKGARAFRRSGRPPYATL